MIQFNLLPDIKLEFMKARRSKHMVMMVSTISTAVALTILVVLFLAVNVFQRNHLNNLSDDIKRDSQTLENTPNLNKVLTVQKQLESLPSLHAAKPKVTRLFQYLPQLTPDKGTIAKFEINYDTQTILLSSTADSLSTVNKLIDTFKFTTYKLGEEPEVKAFSNVVMTGFTKNESDVSSEITLNFDPVIFDGNQEVKLIVPPITSSRSATEKPVIFQAPGQPEVPDTNQTNR